MTSYSRGDVVLVHFPFTSVTASKQRRAIVIASDQYSRTSPDVVIASVTSQLNALPHSGDHVIADWQGAGLLRPSLFQTKIATVEQSMIARRLGRLGADDWTAVEVDLRAALGRS